MYKMHFGELEVNGYPDMVEFPVLPQKISEKGGLDNKKYTLLAIGEVVSPGLSKLGEWSISGAFQWEDEVKPEYYIDLIKKLASTDQKKKNFKFVLIRINPDGSISYKANSLAVINSYTFEDKEGEPGDIHYTLNIMEYKTFEPRVIKWADIK